MSQAELLDQLLAAETMADARQKRDCAQLLNLADSNLQRFRCSSRH